MPRKKKSKVGILYYEIMLTDGTSYRMVLDHHKVGGYRVYEIDNNHWSGIPVLRGPISISDFLHLLENELTKRSQSE